MKENGKENCRDVLFLSQVSKPASQEDLYLAKDLQDTLLANRLRPVSVWQPIWLVCRSVSLSLILAWFPWSCLTPFSFPIKGPYETEEGCLSLTGVRPTTRYETITVSYRDSKWEEQTITLTGFQLRSANMNWIIWKDGLFRRNSDETHTFLNLFLSQRLGISFLPPLNLTSWEFIFFLLGIWWWWEFLFSFHKDTNLLKTVHLRHGKAAKDLNLEGFLFTKLSRGLFLTAAIIFVLAGLVSLVTSSFFQKKLC